jgi:hypothetical protein
MKNPDVHYTGSWIGPGDDQDTAEKRISCSWWGSNTDISKVQTEVHSLHKLSYRCSFPDTEHVENIDICRYCLSQSHVYEYKENFLQ